MQKQQMTQFDFLWFFFSHLKKYSDDYSKFKGRFFFLKLLSPLNISNVWLLFFVTINTIKSNHRNVIKHQIQHEMIDDKKYKCKFLCINDSRIWFLCSIPFFFWLMANKSKQREGEVVVILMLWLMTPRACVSSPQHAGLLVVMNGEGKKNNERPSNATNQTFATFAVLLSPILDWHVG